MAFRELTNGIPVFTEDGIKVGESKAAAKSAIGQVVVSRILMAMPGMCKYNQMMNTLVIYRSVIAVAEPVGARGFVSTPLVHPLTEPLFS